MQLLHDHPRVNDTPPMSTEVLIEEARQRHHRRQRISAALLAALLVAGAVVYLAQRFGTATTASPHTGLTPASPTAVDRSAFQGHGILAFVSKGALFVLNGATGKLDRLTTGHNTASNPVISPDGRWLAFSQSAAIDATVGASASSSEVLYVAGTDGTGLHRVLGLSNASIVGWSPSADLLAVTTRPNNSSGLPTPQTMTLATVTPQGAVHALFSVTSGVANYTTLENAMWSPDGTSIAVATSGFSPRSRTRLLSVNVHSGAETTWLSMSTMSKLAGMDEIVVDPAGWWSGWGIGFWVFGNGMTHNNDQAPLMMIRAPGATPTEIGTTLSDGTTDAIAIGGVGELAIVSNGGGRDIGQSGTEVETCSATTLSCHSVPNAEIWNGPAQPCSPPGRCFNTVRAGDVGSGVTIDPAWSPDGSMLAYVKSPQALQDSAPIAPWLNAHLLFVFDPVTGKSTKLADVSGASVPQWSRSGDDLLYVSDDSLWLASVHGSKPTRIAGPLFGGNSFADAYPSYYHQIPFDVQFAWWSRK